MPIISSLTEQEVRTVADAALRAQLEHHGFDHVEVRSGRDHDGDDALFVTAVVGADVGAVPGDVLSRAHEALDEGLRARGERRFPYFKLRRIGDGPIDDRGMKL